MTINYPRAHTAHDTRREAEQIGCTNGNDRKTKSEKNVENTWQSELNGKTFIKYIFQLQRLSEWDVNTTFNHMLADIGFSFDRYFSRTRAHLPHSLFSFVFRLCSAEISNQATAVFYRIATQFFGHISLRSTVIWCYSYLHSHSYSYSSAIIYFC